MSERLQLSTSCDIPRGPKVFFPLVKHIPMLVAWFRIVKVACSCSRRMVIFVVDGGVVSRQVVTWKVLRGIRCVMLWHSKLPPRGQMAVS